MSKTVRFNVGGKVCEVSRSLLEQHPNTMLACMIGKHWQSEENDILFIDRNGERFQHVLDCMRDRQVHLPVTVAKAAFLVDLGYCGFDADFQPDEQNSKNGKPPVIQQGNLAELSQVMAAVEDNNDDDLKKLDESIQKYRHEIEQKEHQKAAIKTAHILFKRSSNSSWNLEENSTEGNVERTTIKIHRDEYGTDARTVYRNAEKALEVREFLKQRLGEIYGLALIDGYQRGIIPSGTVHFVLERKGGQNQE